MVEAAGGHENWFPQLKLEIVKRKLAGENPADVMCREVDYSMHVSTFGNTYVRTVKDHIRGVRPNDAAEGGGRARRGGWPALGCPN